MLGDGLVRRGRSRRVVVAGSPKRAPRGSAPVGGARGSRLAVPGSSVGVVSNGFAVEELDSPSGNSAMIDVGASPAQSPVLPIPAGSFVSVVMAVSRNFGSAVTFTGVTDSEGNQYVVDTQTPPGGLFSPTLAVAHGVLDHALTASDTLTVSWTGSFDPGFGLGYVYASAFSGIGNIVDGAPGSVDSNSATVSAAAGDVVMGYTMANGEFNINDSASPWNDFMDAPNPGTTNQGIDGAYQIAPASGSVTYTTTNSSPDPTPEDAIAIAYRPSGGAPTYGPLLASEAPTGCGCAVGTGGDPVNTESGNFFQSFTDISIPGRSYPLAVQRTYNSQNASVNGPFGYGWSFNYGMSVAVSGSSPNEVATVTEENGAQIPFDQPASGNTWAPASSFPDTLTYNPGSATWTFVRDARDTDTFNSSGQLTQEQDLNGYVTSLSYTGGNLSTVTDPEGRTLTFGWTGSNITTVTDANVSGNTRTVTYGYSGGNLTSVTDVNGGITDMAYDSSNRMVLLRAPDFHANGALPGSGPATCSSTPTADAINNHYNSSGQVDCQWDPKGQETGFAYSGTPQTASGGATVVTDPAGHEIQDSYAYGVRIAQTMGYGTSAAATTYFMYDPATLAVTEVQDPNGNQTVYTVDGSGNVLTVTDPLGREWAYTYNAFNEVLTAEDPNGVTTTNTYDAHGNLTSTSTPLTSTTATATNCASPSTPVAMAQVTCYTYGNATFPGDLTQMTDPDGNTTFYHHDANGYVDEVKDPLGHVTAIVRNNDGWITAAYTPKAGCTWNSNAPAGCSSSYETQYSYVVPGGSSTNEFGDVGSVTGPLGHATKYTYDADRNLLTVIDRNGNTTTNAYDPDGELCWTLPGGSSSSTCSSPPTNARVIDYNGDGTVADFKDGKGNTIESFGYNTRGQVDSSTDALSNTTTYTLDADGNVLTQLDPISGATCTGTQVGCTTYTYDADDELKTVSYSDSPSENITNIGYDSDGQRTGMTDATGTSSWSYDSLHRLTGYTNGNGATVAYGYTYGSGPSYDLDDQVRSIAYPNSVGTVTQSWNADGTLASVSDWNGKQTTFAYDANGNQTGQTSPSTTPVTDTFGYSSADAMTSVSDSNGTTLFSATYTRNLDGLVNGDSSQASNQAKYQYTALDQLCYAGSANTSACTSPPASSYPYAFDNADNLTSMENAAHSATNTLQYNAADELCWTVAGTSSNSCSSAPTGATSYTFDNKGNRTHLAPSSGAQTCYTYDQANRLTKIQTGTGSTCSTPTTVAIYGYDGDGIRESKTVGSATIQFTWDGLGGNLLQQNNGTTDTSYIYGPGGIPVEQIAGTTTTYLHHDQLGSIRLITDAAGSTSTASTKTWDPFGNQVSSTGSLTSSFGYAGQYTDPTTGFQYDRARYYDPSTGQFLNRDPLQALTRQPYAYASGDPLNNTDPSGEFNLGTVFATAAVIGGEALVEVATDGAATPVLAAIDDGAAADVAAPAAETADMGVEQADAAQEEGGLANAATEDVEACPSEPATEDAGSASRLVIGRTSDLEAPGALQPGEYTLSDQLPTQGSPQANWIQNSRVLREELRSGITQIRDASPGDTGGQFLNAERNILTIRGWTFDPSTSMWNAP